jgi:integrase
LHRLTPEAVNKWKVSAMASDSPIQQKHSSATVRSILLCSKAMFSKQIRKHLTLQLPSPLPFDDVALPKVGNRRYRSEINPSLLLQQAQRELAEARPELYKALLLAIGAGLRRDEIDKLQWSQIKWDKSLIRIEVSEHAGTKSRESEADVHVDSGLLEILKSYLPKPGHKCSAFVIESPVQPRLSAKNHHYRCNRTFKQLIEWLRSKGLKARNGIHALRKEFGSLICQQAGIFAASTALRHSSIALTRDVYVDNKAPAVLNIGALLNSQPATKTRKAKVA